MSRMVWLLRSAATLIVFGVFSFGAIFFGVPVFFLLTLVIRNRRCRCLVLRFLVKTGFRFIIFISGLMCVFRVRFAVCDEAPESAGEEHLRFVSGRELFADIPENRSVIIANHPTLVDYVILTSVMNTNVNSMVKKSLTDGFMRHVISHLGYVNNQSPFEDVAAAAQSGDNLLIFPEGSRTRGDITFRRGAANLAVRLDMDIVPVFIYCSEPDYLSRGFLNISAPSHVPCFYVTRGKSIRPSDVNAGDSLPSAVMARHFNRYLEELYRHRLPRFAERTVSEAGSDR